MSSTYAWTIMVYLAGDNNLERYGSVDLNEMKQGSTSDAIAIVAEFDRMSDQVTRRYRLTNGPSLEADCVAELPEINTGDPAALVDFVTWACQAYPADRYALVLWNHGAGWKDDDIYRIAREQHVSDVASRGMLRGAGAGRTSRALFKATVARLVAEAARHERAILFDDSSADFLDNLEMRSALQSIASTLGRPLDLLGFDACLMNMVEVAYQVRDLSRVVVGSQEIEPGDGWPYRAIGSALAQEPALDATQLGTTIVQCYTDFYRTQFPRLSVTQSCIDLSRMPALSGALDALAGALIATLDEVLVYKVLRSAQTFQDPDYIDLVDFCQLLAAGAPATPAGQSAQAVVDLFGGAGSPVLATDHSGPGMDHAYGVSIYLPVRGLSPLYAELDFARQCRWRDFLAALMRPVGR